MRFNIVALEKFSLIVCTVCGALSLFYFLVAMYSVWHSLSPNVAAPEDFNYSYVTSGKYILGIREQNQFLFAGISPEEFENKRQTLLNIALADEAEEHPRRFLTALVYTTLYLCIFWIYWRILKRTRFITRR